MAEDRLYPRFVDRRLAEALADSPVVLIHGPRQCGKTTLARRIGDRAGYGYFTFDDPVTLAAASEDPVGFVAELPERTILDEVQRVSRAAWCCTTARSQFRSGTGSSPCRSVACGSLDCERLCAFY